MGQWVFTAAVLAFAVWALAHQWARIGPRIVHLRPDWALLAAASAAVLATYAILIETWRRVLGAWDTRLGWWTAARIWFASSLGKYIPGNVWSIAALGVMARGSGASAVAAAGSSVLVNVLSLASGAAVVLVFAARLVPAPGVVIAVAVLVTAGALAAPWLVPGAVRWITRVTGRQIRLAPLPASTVWIALLGTTLGWLGYGLAFRLFTTAVLGAAARPGHVLLYIGAYTGAYILGFVTPVAPAGLGVREFAIAEGLARLGLTTGPEGVIVALASRVWLTVLEVAPGLVALAMTHARRSRSRPRPRHA